MVIKFVGQGHGEVWKNSQEENIFGYAATLPGKMKADLTLKL